MLKHAQFKIKLMQSTFQAENPDLQFSMQFHAKSHDQLYAVRKPIKQAIIAQNVNRGKR